MIREIQPSKCPELTKLWAFFIVYLHPLPPERSRVSFHVAVLHQLIENVNFL